VLLRQHAGSIRWKATSELVHCGETETGEVWEQSGYVENVDTLEQLPLRRIELRLKVPTRDGDTVLGLLTNLPPEISAIVVADAYPKRWQIETAFQEIEGLLSGEINTLSYPEAALFSLSCAYVAFNILQCIRLTLEASRGEQTDEISLYYVADDVSHTWRGLDAVLSDEDWDCFRTMTPRELSKTLCGLAKLVPYRKYTKRRSNSKTGSTPRPPTKRKNHVSAARLINQKHDKID
jgi:hypothetical protein